MIVVESSPVATTLTVEGDLDLAARDAFPEATLAVRRHAKQVVVLDLCGVPFMDSTGAGFLIAVATAVRERSGVAVLRGAGDQQLDVLELVGADALFRVDEDHEPCRSRGRVPNGTETR